MSAERFNADLIPPSVTDERAVAFAETARRALAEPDFRKLLVERIDDVDAALLPFLVREFGLHKFVEPDMDEAVIRRMLKGAFELRKEIGYIRGVRFGLGLLGLGVTRWVQWFQSAPKGLPGTHKVRVAIEEHVFPEAAISARLLRAIGRMVRNTQRASQEIGFQIQTEADAAPVRIGVGFATRARFRMAAEPRPTLHGDVSVSIGMALASRIRYRMGV